MNKKHNNNRGFTLVELIIYILVVSVILISATYYAIDVIGAQTKARSYQEVQQNARLALRRMVQEIRAAENLNEGSSVFDSNPGTLSLDHTDPAKDPTIFDVSSGRLRITQGGNGPYYLTTDQAIVSDLTFENLSVSGRNKVIKITLTLDHVNPENRSDFEASLSVYSTAVIRSQSD